MNRIKRLADALAVGARALEASEDIIDMAGKCGETLREMLAIG